MLTQTARKEVELTLGRKIPDGIWGLLEDEGHVREVCDGYADIDYLVGKARRYTKLLEIPPVQKNADADLGVVLNEVTWDRQWALGLILAQNADQDKDVVSFRSKFLDGKFLKEDMLDDWVDSPSASPALRKLAGLASSLGSRYGWGMRDAALFVLMGHIPPVRLISARAESTDSSLTARIVLTIDPGVTPSEVAAYYQRKREMLLLRPGRALPRRHIFLVEFCSRRPKGEAWAETMKRWNDVWKSKEPEWAYSQESNLRRDYYKARRKLIQPPLS